MQNEAPSKRHILEVVTKARHEGLMNKQFLATPSKNTKKIDSLKAPAPLSYKELSERKKKLDEEKKQKKAKKKDDELRQKIKEEQEKLRKLEEEKAKKRPPPVVTLQSLVKFSYRNLYNDNSTEDTHNDSTLNFVRNLIADDGDESRREGRIVEIMQLENDDKTGYLEVPQIKKHDENYDIVSTAEFAAPDKPVVAVTINGEPHEDRALEQIPSEEVSNKASSVHETVNVVVNTKTNKKIKAILPKDHQRNLKPGHSKTHQKGQMVVYDPKKANENVRKILIINHI